MPAGRGWWSPGHSFWCLLPGLRLGQGLWWLALRTMAVRTHELLAPQASHIRLPAPRGGRQSLIPARVRGKRELSGRRMSVGSMWCSPSGFSLRVADSAGFWMSKSECVVGKTAQGGEWEGFPPSREHSTQRVPSTTQVLVG